MTKTKKNGIFCLIISTVILLAVFAAPPVQAAFGIQASGNANEQAHNSSGSQGMMEEMMQEAAASAGGEKGIQTTLPIIYGLFVVVILLVLVILYIVFIKIRRNKTHDEIIYEKTSTEENKAVSGTQIKTTAGFPPELAQAYSEVSLVGRGGLSYVYSAKRNDNGETVAIKVPLLKDEISGRVFLQEIKIWEGLSHPNIVKIKSVNVFPVPHVEMEYVTDSLEDLKVPLNPEIALSIMAGVLRGLSYAHSRGIIHCDIKPGNILIDSEFTPKIADWGVGKHIESSQSISGYTPAFAAPEQTAQGNENKCSVRTDIFQAGMLLYWMLCGKTANESEYSGGKIKNHSIMVEKPLPESGREAIDYEKNRKINEIVIKCLQIDPEKRYSSADEMLMAVLSLSGRTIIG